MPARLRGHRAKTGGKWEGLFLRELSASRWELLVKSRGRVSEGESIVVDGKLHLTLEARGERGTWIMHVNNNEYKNVRTCDLLEQFGSTPLPPYIRGGGPTPDDRFTYQTIYAENAGSVAAPTAGLHFTDNLFANLAKHNISWVDLTLHVGVATFRPIEVQYLDDHKMHAEWAEISKASASQLNSGRSAGGRIIAVGTTAVRTLETAALSGDIVPFVGATELFVRPGHVFRGIDALITNFHLPRSSLLVLVGSFAGFELMRAAYEEAIRQHYRFYSYGDAMLIL